MQKIYFQIKYLVEVTTTGNIDFFMKIFDFCLNIEVDNAVSF